MINPISKHADAFLFAAEAFRRFWDAMFKLEVDKQQAEIGDIMAD